MRLPNLFGSPVKYPADAHRYIIKVLQLGGLAVIECGIVGYDVVDLAHRLASTFQHAHLQQVLESVGRGEIGCGGESRTRIRFGEFEDHPHSRKLSIGCAVVIGEAIPNFESPWRVNADELPDAADFLDIRPPYVILGSAAVSYLVSRECCRPRWRHPKLFYLLRIHVGLPQADYRDREFANKGCRQFDVLC